MEVEYGHASKLPPGFQFDPSDEELILHFLYARAFSVDNFHSNIIPDLDICAVDPWGLNGKALFGCNKWYFYSKSNKEVGGEREMETGYWKVQDDVEDEAIYSSSAGGKKIGWKRFYVFYIKPPLGIQTSWSEPLFANWSEPPLGIQTSWVLEEYHLSKNAHGRSWHLSDTERWVLCRVLEVNDCNCRGLSFHPDQAGMDDSNEAELSSLDEAFLSLEEDDGQTME